MMEYKGYIGKVEFDPDAKMLHGEVIGIRDVVTFQGLSVKEIEKAFHESVDDYLAFCTERGETPNKPFSGQFLLRLDPDLHRWASMVAQAKGTSLNAVVVESLSKALPERFSKPVARQKRAVRAHRSPLKAQKKASFR